MNRKKLSSLVEKLLDEKLKGAKSFSDESLFVGYNPLEKIRGGLFHWVAVPFNGTEVFCQLRCPNGTQIEQCGDISNITIDGKSQMTDDEIITIRNYQEELCKLVFNIPTFDHITSLVDKYDFVISEKKKELNEIKEKFERNKDALTDTQKETLLMRMEILELHLGYILPNDTMAFITRWAMGNDISDIKKITRETFLRAAALAERHHKAPSDYITGVLTDFNRNEIDAFAVSVYSDFLKDQKTVKDSGKFRWILGGNRQNSSILSKKTGDE